MRRMTTGRIFKVQMKTRESITRLNPIVSLGVAATFALLLILPGAASAQLNAKAVSSGTDHTCAIEPSGQVVCWGDNSEGQLGDGTTDSSLTPVKVKGTGAGDAWLDDATKIDSGAYHTCAVRRYGQAVCWGYNVYGQLGNDRTASSSIPVKVENMYNAKQIDAGSGHTCAIRQTGQALCWGNNPHGQLGDGSETGRLTPAAIFGLYRTWRISGGVAHTCAIRTLGQVTTSGHVVCWGSSSVGQLGDGSYSQRSLPKNTGILDNAVEISAGDLHTCAIQSSGRVVCWGDNDFGQLGDGSTDGIAAPVEVSGLDDAGQISAGKDHSCAIRTNGVAVCWGSNEFGQLGSEAGSQTPVIAAGLDNALKISAGGSHTCAIRGSGESGPVVCWGGIGRGNLGDGDSDNETWGDLIPIPRPSARRAVFAPLKITPRLKRIHHGRKAVFRVKVRNTGGTPAVKVKVCGRIPKRSLGSGGCVTLGRILPGRAKTAKITVTVRRRAAEGRRVRVRFSVSGKGMKKRTAGAVLVVK